METATTKTNHAANFQIARPQTTLICRFALRHESASPTDGFLNSVQDDRRGVERGVSCQSRIVYRFENPQAFPFIPATVPQLDHQEFLARQVADDTDTKTIPVRSNLRPAEHCLQGRMGGHGKPRIDTLCHR